MNYINDLRIESELLPLFDCSLNKFSKGKILEILQSPLNSKDEILRRQSIFKGFILNHNILKNYSYTVLYLNEVHDFLNNWQLEHILDKKLKFKYFTSKNVKIAYASKLNLLILFFHRLQTHYFSKIELKLFPEFYIQNINDIRTFLNLFNLSKYENLIRESRLKDKHLIEISSIISNLKSKNQIFEFWDGLFLFEAYLSISLSLESRNFTFPNFTDKGIILKGFYHPLLYKATKNDFRTSSNVVILNGPNMSGKSTFFKAIGLCMYFGHLGFGIPAAKGEIPFCTDFSIRINRSDDILNGYSHFMSEIINLKNVVVKASKGNPCFAIFDELFSGTNLEDALELSRTTINGLRKFKNSYFFISTHIQELKYTSLKALETYYLDCELLDDKPTFTYKIKKGWSVIRIGRILFDKEGLNKLLN